MTVDLVIRGLPSLSWGRHPRDRPIPRPPAEPRPMPPPTALPERPQIDQPAALRLRPLADKPVGSLVVHEIYRSIQGESAYTGLPCVFVRLTACHLRCGYCDTPHAFHAGETLALDEVVETGAGAGRRAWSRSPAASRCSSPRCSRS